MRKILFLIFLLLFVKKVQAQIYYFDYQTGSYLIPYNSELNIKFLSSLKRYKLSDFRVKPIVSSGVAFIYNKALSKWVSSSDFWTNLPSLEENMTVRLLRLKNNKDKLSFEIQNKLDGNIYRTPEREFWNYSILDGYLNKVNKNLNSLSTEVNESSPAIPNKTPDRQNILSKMLKLVDELLQKMGISPDHDDHNIY